MSKCQKYQCLDGTSIKRKVFYSFGSTSDESNEWTEHDLIPQVQAQKSGGLERERSHQRKNKKPFRIS